MARVTTRVTGLHNVRNRFRLKTTAKSIAS